MSDTDAVKPYPRTTQATDRAEKAAAMDGTYFNAQRPISMEGAMHAAAALERDADDAVLLEACRRGDSTAYGVLVQRYQDRVHNLCWRLCGDADEAADFAQEAFVKAYKALDQFAGRSRFYTWLYRIAANLIISAGRKRDFRGVGSLDAPGRTSKGETSTSRVDSLASDVASPADGVLNRERDEVIARALALLDDEQRTVIALRDMEALSYEEIADILDVPTGTIKSRLHRARTALRELLGPMLDMD